MFVAARFLLFCCSNWKHVVSFFLASMTCRTASRPLPLSNSRKATVNHEKFPIAYLRIETRKALYHYGKQLSLFVFEVTQLFSHND